MGLTADLEGLTILCIMIRFSQVGYVIQKMEGNEIIVTPRTFLFV